MRMGCEKVKMETQRKCEKEGCKEYYRYLLEVTCGCSDCSKQPAYYNTANIGNDDDSRIL